MSLANDLCGGSQRRADKKSARALKEVGLEDRMGHTSSQLSGGQNAKGGKLPELYR